MRPWSSIPIQECGEPLVALPESLLCLEPHPYQTLGAPYGPGASPFRLREQVVLRLLRAQIELQRRQPHWRLAIFDGWRPLAVQSFMVAHTIREQCERAGIEPNGTSPERDRVVTEVLRFWASPSQDPATPPPHSTGAAVDLTLVQADGSGLAMGSAIDAIGPVSEPDHFLACAERSNDEAQRQDFLRWHRHRLGLREAMQAAGFAQHPNEWWHFSWGDQLWAWSTAHPVACYGRTPEACNRLET
jgi:D-alanyl-D-alanine dipeptidase